MDTKKETLKATGIVGCAQLFLIFIRIVRTKIIAILLGPAGVGIAGLYYSTLELVRSGTGFGLDFSAVRNVAEAAGTGDQFRIRRTITILRRWVWVTGLLGLTIMVLLRRQFSQYAFNDTEHAFDFLILALVPLFTALSGGQMAMLRGVRRIGDMAQASVLGAVAGLFITVPFYWLMGIKGIPPALILSALTELGLSWYFAQRIKLPSITITLRETVTGGASMVWLGLFTVITGLAGTGTMYLVRIFIVEQIGVDGVGQFQAAWNLSAIYVGLVLGAMAADYFPRLSAVHQDNMQVCRLVNEQTEISLLLGCPLIVGMLCFMHVIISLFYSVKFGQSIDILLWQTMGNLLKVIAFPIGFVLLAKSKGGIYICTELLWNILFLIIIRLFWGKVGLEVAGIAFFVGYFALTITIYIVCRIMCGFSWSRKNKINILFFVLVTLIAFLNARYQSLTYWRLINLGLLVSAVFYSIYHLKNIIDFKMVSGKILQKIRLSWFRKYR